MTTSTRENLHRVAAHVLGRARFQVTGRFGLRAAPGGFATPAFGDGPEVLRVAAGVLVHETAGGATYTVIDGSSLVDLAGAVGLGLDPGFSVGAETPPLCDVEQPLDLDLGTARMLADWLATGQRLLDAVCAVLPPEAAPAVVQLWPEHFDLGTSMTLPGGGHANLGASLGDGFSEEPYLYVGPWGVAPPDDAAYWNAPFGAVRRRSGSGDRALQAGPGEEGTFDAGLEFYLAGLRILGFEVGG